MLNFWKPCPYADCKRKCETIERQLGLDIVSVANEVLSLTLMKPFCKLLYCIRCDFV